MKSPSRLLASLMLVVAGSVAFAADPAPAAPAAGQAKEKHPETELYEKMEKMETAYKKLRRQAPDVGQNAASLAQVAIIREIAEASAKLKPYKATEIPAADRAKMVEGYQTKIKELLVVIGKLEAAFKAGQNEEAVKLVKALHDLEKEGHKEYKSESFK